ncbi:LysR family transcriptional regulator [Vreelandella utahensis]|uniref:LysR family transcriptional regulator n=1 Tax=Vreelandella halophila TaxID=86177 RepID=UPI0009877C43|nr:LysR family transcriptional regulator [Halomonas utahensis]
MRYDLNLLRTFIALLEERSVTRAAKRLGITQPALSNTLARCRELFQDPLFIRERYGMRPTEKALAIGPAIRDALGEIDHLVLEQQTFDPATTTMRFVIAANDYVEYVFVPRLVERLQHRAPGIQIRIVPYGADLAETGVAAGDTALVLGRIVDPPDNLVVQSLMEDGLACVLRADHPFQGEQLTREAFESLKHVNMLPPGRLKKGLFEALGRQGLERDVAVSVTHFLSIPELIATTDYCTTLPQLICRRFVRDPRLRVVTPPADLGTFPVHLGWHVRYRQDPAHQWLREQIHDVARELMSEREGEGNYQ